MDGEDSRPLATRERSVRWTRHLARRTDLPLPGACALSLALILALAILAARSPTGAAAAAFGRGDLVRVDTDALNLRSGPGLDASVLQVLRSGFLGAIADDPIAAGGYTWYLLESERGILGWVAGEYLALVAWGPGSVVEVVDGPLNLRDAPGLAGTVVAALPTGAGLTVVELGPLLVDGYAWLPVSSVTYGGGWVASAYLTLDT